MSDGPPETCRAATLPRSTFRRRKFSTISASTGRAPLRVAFLNWRDTGHPDAGGAEVYAEQVVDGLAAKGHDVTLVTAHYPGSARTSQRPSGARVHRVGGRLGVYPAAALAVLRHRVPQPDVIIEAQNGMPFFAGAWHRSAAHVVLVHHVHKEQWPVVFPGPVAAAGWFLESRVAPRVNRHSPYVAVSQVTKDELVQQGIDPARVEVIHNGALPPPPHDVARTPHPQLLVLGRIVPHKRLELALDTIAALRADHPEARLVIAGRGWWDERIREEILVRGLSDVVDHRGFVSDHERHELYASSWISLVPSLKEGWGLVVVEAGMHATPTIAFDGTGGITESIVDGVTGLLAKHDDLEDFVRLTRRLIEDDVERKRLGSAAADFAAQFTWAMTVERWEATLYEAIASGRR